MEFMPSKGTEYLVILAYLVALAAMAWVIGHLGTGAVPARVRSRAPGRSRASSSWFSVPLGYRFHPGHTWALSGGDGVIRVGMDDFAQSLIGPPEELELPAVGTRLRQGQPGWKARVDGQSVDLLSPVEGVVTEVNPQVAGDPGAVCRDPYGSGWLLKVQAPDDRRELGKLMSWERAREWMDETADRVSRLMSPEMGAVMQDGGRPVPGFARPLGGERWLELAGELLLTREARDEE